MVVGSAVGPGKFFLSKLIRFGQILLDLDEIWTNLRRNLNNIEAKFGQK